MHLDPLPRVDDDNLSVHSTKTVLGSIFQTENGCLFIGQRRLNNERIRVAHSALDLFSQRDGHLKARFGGGVGRDLCCRFDFWRRGWVGVRRALGNADHNHARKTQPTTPIGFFTLVPQCGQAFASVLTCPPHSWHGFILMTSPRVVVVPDDKAQARSG